MHFVFLVFAYCWLNMAVFFGEYHLIVLDFYGFSQEGGVWESSSNVVDNFYLLDTLIQQSFGTKKVQRSQDEHCE